jgi:hypothetical protein
VIGKLSNNYMGNHVENLLDGGKQALTGINLMVFSEIIGMRNKGKQPSTF